MQREKLSSRLGFIMLSAGCAIGCGNIWKFPWMTGQNGGGGFVLIYIIFLLLLGLPVMVMELSLGRAAQASPVKMFQKLEKKGQKWHFHGYLALAGNICLMAFYTVVSGWMINYFCKFASGNTAEIGFSTMAADPGTNVLFMGIVVFIGFFVISFKLNGGLEKVTKYMMLAMLGLMVVLVVFSMNLSGASEGLNFYLVPDFLKITGSTIVAAMNQAFFTLSIGIGSIAIFGSYIGKERSLMGESINIIALDTIVAIMAGLIIFPACFTYDLEVTSGPSLLFDTMATVFNNMENGQIWGSAFFLFMVFAAMTTVMAVFENILACVRELTGWSRKKTCLICGIGIFGISITTALGFNLWSDFQPFAEGSGWMDIWTFIVETNLLPLGSLIIILFCCSNRYGWGWNNFLSEANAGKGLKFKSWIRPYVTYVLPVIIIFLYIYGLTTFKW